MTNNIRNQERDVLDSAERSALVGLVCQAMPWRAGRPLPRQYQSLINKGLAFQSATLVTITTHGEHVAERVA